MTAEQPKYEPLKNQETLVNAGALKEKDKEALESRIADTLRALNGRLTKKEIVALMSRIEVGRGLDGLKQELEKEKKLAGSEISDDVLREILNLFREAQEVAGSSLEELKLEISKLNISREYEVDHAATYLTHRFPWIKRLEESELGENIVLDLAGALVGAVDSAHAVLKFFLTLLKDLALLPRDIIAHVKQK